MIKKHIKLICTDIDGTLLTEERWISDRTVSAFAKARLPIILASSRPPQAMRYLQDRLNISEAPLIAFNGGLILKRNNVVLESNTFSKDILESLMTHHAQHRYNLSIYSHEEWFTCKEDNHTKHEMFTTRDSPIIQKASYTLKYLKSKKQGVHKMMCMGDPDELDDLTKYLEITHHDAIHLYRSKDTYLEITPKFIDKAKALHKLLTSEYSFGMEAVMSFGDNHNDVELLRQSALSVAVKNATIELKSIADIVSLYTNKEDAVAREIEKCKF